MGKPYSMDLRERVVAAVETGGMSCHQAAAQFGVGVSTAINWVTALAGDRQRCARPDGRAQAEGDFGRAPCLVAGAHQGKGLHLARAGRRTGRAWPQGRLSDGVELRPRREAELQKKPWWPANAIVPTSRAGGRSGASIKTASSLSVWSSSTRPGPRPTWRRCADGRRVACGSRPRSRTVTGRPRPSWPRYATTGSTRHGCLDGPIDGESFQTYVEKVLVPTLCPGDIVDHGQSRQSQGQSRSPAHPRGRRQAFLPAQILARPEPHRTGLRQAQAPVAQSRRPLRRSHLHRNRPNPRSFTPDECANYFTNSGYAPT